MVNIIVGVNVVNENIAAPVIVFVITNVFVQFVDLKYPVDNIMKPPLQEATNVPSFIYDAVFIF